MNLSEDNEPIRPYADMSRRNKPREWVGLVLVVALIAALVTFAWHELFDDSSFMNKVALSQPPTDNGTDVTGSKYAQSVSVPEATKEATDSYTYLLGDVNQKQDSALKLDTFWGDFCYTWYGWASIVIVDDSGNMVQTNPYLAYKDAAAKLYPDLAAQFGREYGTSKPLPDFNTAQTSACLVI